MRQLGAALSKSLRNPAYLRYLWQNVHVVRDHFPGMYGLLMKRRNLRLGGEAGLSKLHVILRTTDAVMNMNSSRRLEDAGIFTKTDVIRFGALTLFPAAARFAAAHGPENIRITVVEDRLSAAGAKLYRAAAAAAGLAVEMVRAGDSGNGPTFQTQIDLALADGSDTLVFLLEDDYRLDEEVLTRCFGVMSRHSGVIGMNPHFHPDRIRRHDYGRLAVVDGRLYCRVRSTCCTFFMPAAMVRRFERHLRMYDGWEDGSVNRAWRRGVCLAPVGWTMAEHLHRSDLSPVQTLVARGDDGE